ncbi:MAG TPA: hypothetical protein VF081_03495 [Solirubrobacterales bacterium]
MKYVGDFEPVDHVAARKAKAWLETNVEGRFLSHQVHLVYSEDESQLFGFFVVHEVEVQPAPRDVGRMQVRSAVDEGGAERKTIEDPRAASQRAMKIAWIARSENSPADVGGEMFDHAVELGERSGCCAMMVEPYDDDTARRLWIEHYAFIEGEEGDDEWSSCLWYALGEPNQTFN